METLNLTQEEYRNVLLLMQMLVAAIGLGCIFFQIWQQKKLEKSKFILMLTQEALKYSDTLTKLDKDKTFNFKGDDSAEEQARSFVRVIEAMMLLVEEGSITQEEIFPILGYRILTFMDHPKVREHLLKGLGHSHPARFCGAYALYERIFSYKLERFADNIPGVLLEYGHENYAESLYWDKGFISAVSIYYRHKSVRKSKAIMYRIVENRMLVERTIGRSNSLGK